MTVDMAVLPVLPVVRPLSLLNELNGRLTLKNLRSVFFPTVGHGSLHPNAARAWQAMTVSCLAETRIQLTVTSVADAYRDYTLQERVFRQRYRSVFNPLTCTRQDSRRWNGVTWWKLKNVAPVAVPGTSNHGWGLAVDAAVASVTGPKALAGDQTAWTWVQKNASSFGFSWESQQEPWHIRYVTGDVIPQRVIDIEMFLSGGKA